MSMVSVHCIRVTRSVFKRLKKQGKRSHKYQNGVSLAIAGSRQYHGSLVFSAVAASRIVDLLHVCTAKENFPIVKKSSPAFIVHPMQKAISIAKECDSVLIGPGIEESKANSRLIQKLLKLAGKKVVLDATALRLAKPEWLHPNCCVTPHAKEFSALFSMKPSMASALKAARKFDCIVGLKGTVDYISNGKMLYCNYTGNEGMTKGGTGDTLAGLILGFAAKSGLLESTLAAFYLNGYAGDLLKKERGTMFNAADLLERIPLAFKKLGG
jgi:NAD(P)H-hydrate epimerase